MQPSIRHKLASLVDRYEEVRSLLNDPETVQNQTMFRDLSREHAQLEPVVLCFQAFTQALEMQRHAELLLKEEDAEIRELAAEELLSLKKKIESLEQALQLLLLPKDPDDTKNVFLEIRAGTGGDEAAIFVGDLYRMYSRYAEEQSWSSEIISSSPGDYGGFKEIIVRLSGHNVYSKLKFESGAHRVQRVPETESQGRIHTSACTVAIMPEVEDIDEVEIHPDDLRIDTFRASGAGGQHVNRTDSAIRITHLPTGIVVECQDERSQHKNKARAMSILRAKLLSAERTKQQTEQAETRRNLVGSGDRSERIRTYNFPQGRVTDHRIGLTLYKLPEIMNGKLDQVIEPLIQEHQADLLRAMTDESCQ